MLWEGDDGWTDKNDCSGFWKHGRRVYNHPLRLNFKVNPESFFEPSPNAYPLSYVALGAKLMKSCFYNRSSGPLDQPPPISPPFFTSTFRIVFASNRPSDDYSFQD